MTASVHGKTWQMFLKDGPLQLDSSSKKHEQKGGARMQTKKVIERRTRDLGRIGEIVEQHKLKNEFKKDDRLIGES